jgi:hypothetical protein
MPNNILTTKFAGELLHPMTGALKCDPREGGYTRPMKLHRYAQAMNQRLQSRFTGSNIADRWSSTYADIIDMLAESPPCH